MSTLQRSHEGEFERCAFAQRLKVCRAGPAGPGSRILRRSRGGFIGLVPRTPVIELIRFVPITYQPGLWVFVRGQNQIAGEEIEISGGEIEISNNEISAPLRGVISIHDGGGSMMGSTSARLSPRSISVEGCLDILPWQNVGMST